MISIFHRMRIQSKTFMTLLLIALLATFIADGPLSARAQSAVVVAPGFNSQFNGNHYGWTPVNGAWALAPSGSYWTGGLANAVTSIKHTGMHGNMTYQIKVRKASVCSTNCGDIGLMIRGNPLALGPWKDWKPEYWFAYANSGHFHVLYWNASGSYTVLRNWTFSNKIVRGGWNRLKVVAAGSLLGFYINDTLVWSGINPNSQDRSGWDRLFPGSRYGPDVR